MIIKKKSSVSDPRKAIIKKIKEISKDDHIPIEFTQDHTGKIIGIEIGDRDYKITNQTKLQAYINSII